MDKILIIGAGGQIGTELTVYLRNIYGSANVIASDIRATLHNDLMEGGPFIRMDAMDSRQVYQVVQKEKVDQVYFLAAILSAVCEKNPEMAWDINMGCLNSVLRIANELKFKMFVPSSIGAFGENTPKQKTPQLTVQRPNSIYGVTKVAGELLCDYYHARYGIDVRGLRFPGIISNLVPPGGGTTDYAVDIYHKALRNKHYTCYLRGDTYLDMMYMPDALHAAATLMEADHDKLRFHNAYNVSAMSFCPEIIAASIRKHIPDFIIDYEIDPIRQCIADSWPDSMDDSAARQDWGWSPEYDLEMMSQDMITVLRERFRRKEYEETESAS
ncbi:MAG: NAD-dependent epimerase/dehydratase family protein [Candidatus Neomarinimicrobiota bacterium]|nr:NAD-dependent epimerase/dehydratase family protein [Candidatus Neomarinimicrobiota bacterium]